MKLFFLLFAVVAAQVLPAAQRLALFSLYDAVGEWRNLIVSLPTSQKLFRQPATTLFARASHPTKFASTRLNALLATSFECRSSTLACRAL